MGFFAKIKVKPSDQKSVSELQKIALDFSDAVGSDWLCPGMIYDVQKLPHPKADILLACKAMWLLEKDHRGAWVNVLLCVSQFQEAIGRQPMGLDIAKIDQSGDVAAQVLKMRMPSDELLEKCNGEDSSILAWANQMTAGGH